MSFIFSMRPNQRVLIALAIWYAAALLILPIANAGGCSGKDCFRIGKTALENGRYAEAVTNFSAALKEFSVIGDYSLFYLSEAHHGQGEHDKALEDLRSLMALYPDSPLLKKARSREIREANEVSAESLSSLYEAYVRDYPDDDEILFAYGSYLKRTGQLAGAAVLFKKIYLRAGVLAKSAFTELTSADIKASDHIERASNLTSRYAFREAETDLRKALQLDDGRNKAEILRKLGYALFMQKKYKESAALYRDIKDTYFLARSLYRAGDRDGLDAALRELVADNDMRAGNLLIAVAADKRRDNNVEGAVRIYDAVYEGYPAEQEEALWGKGWTYYRAADYKKASDIFSVLYAKYESPKYLYWQAKSTEAAGGDAGTLYDRLLKRENSYYSVLSHARLKAQVSSLAEPAVNADAQYKIAKIDRVDALFSLGMKTEASTELEVMLKKANDSEALYAFISKFHEIGDFKRSVGLVTKTPYTEKNHRLWYPLAYQEIVENIAAEYNVNPFTVLSVIREESRFDASAYSVAGAHGLMQLLPSTARRLDKSIGIGIKTDSDLDIPSINIRLGAFYLKILFEEFRSLPAVLAAYNAGEAAVKRWQKRAYRTPDEFIEDIPYPETRNYVKRIVNSYFQYMRSLPNWQSERGLDFLVKTP